MNNPVYTVYLSAFKKGGKFVLGNLALERRDGTKHTKEEFW